MAQLKTELILETATGIKQAYDVITQNQIFLHYTVAYLKGSKYSEYIVYELPNYNTEGRYKKHKVIKSTEKEDVDFVRSSFTTWI